MFALEINFNDGVSLPEAILVRRPHAIIGTSEFAHVVIEGAPSIPCELRVTRGIGKEFQCQPVKRASGFSVLPTFLEGVYSREVQLSLGEVVVHLTLLDMDLQAEGTESIDRAGIRVLRTALTHTTPFFPAVAVLGSTPVFVSFPDTMPLLIGRSRKCGLRLDSAGVSAEHARIGFQHGHFWIEDLGSTNGTFVAGERISGRRQLAPEETFIIGNEFIIAGVRNESDLKQLSQRTSAQSVVEDERRFPCVITSSEIPRPNRIVLTPGRTVTIGRDPASDIWVGAPHISRMHAQIAMEADGSISVVDLSTNGTYLGTERLQRGQTRMIDESNGIVDLKQGVVFGVCASGEAETEYLRKYKREVAPAPGGRFTAEDLAKTGAMERPPYDIDEIGPDDRLQSVIEQAAEELMSTGAFKDVVKRWGEKEGKPKRQRKFSDWISAKNEEPELSGVSEDVDHTSEDLTVRSDLDDINRADDGAEYPKIGWLGWLVLVVVLVILTLVGVLIFGAR